jgi:hypothetical protein
MKKNIYFYFLILTIVALFSCKEQRNDYPQHDDQLDRIIKEESITVINGILKFNTEESFINIQKYVNCLEYSDFLKWEDSIGFSSMRKKCEQAYSIASTATNLEELESIISEYSKYLILDEFKGELELYMTINKNR